MSYQVLARKWRPRCFQEVVGQDSTVKTLTNILNQKRLHHAYLFTGTRGVGKTSTARILAKCLNCAQGISATPCDTCDMCLSINTGQCVDLIEVDAASRTKVEDTRELLNNTQYAPSNGRYKIYLIDEVHMLSNHSFNALLKTLEEPPPHILFLLATTDTQKLPATILSRCLQFHLKSVPAEEIAQHLGEILSKEGIIYEKAALHTLALAADGSIRDALSLLDQAIGYTNNNINNPDIIKLLGNTPKQYLIDLIYQLSQHNPKKLLEMTSSLQEQSIDFARTLEGLLLLLHQIAILQAVPDAPLSEEWQDCEALRQLAANISRETIQLYYQIALIGRRDLALASSPKNGFEMVVLRMLAFDCVDSSLHTPKLEEKKLTEVPVQISLSPTESSPSLIPSPALRAPSPACVRGEAGSNTKENWSSLITKIGLTGMAYTLATHCSLQNMDLDKNTIILTLAPKHVPLLTPTQQERLSKALNNYFNKSLYLEINITENSQASPAELTKINAKQALQEDDTLQNFIKQFDAKVIPNSIESNKI